MTVIALCTFLDGGKRYEEGQKYEVSDEALAAYFIDNGWAEGPYHVHSPRVTEHVSLDIHSVTHHTTRST